MSARLRAGSESGATLVEYAMLIALVLVVSIGAIGALEDRADDRAEASEDRVGDPDDNAFYGGGTTGGTSGGSTTGGTSPPAVTLALSGPPAADPPPVEANPDNKWNAFATITVNDGGSPVIGVTVTGVWTIDGTGQAEEVTCPTGATGECQVQFNGVGDNRKTVTFTVTKLEKDVAVVVPAPPNSVQVDCRTVSPAIC